MKPLHCILSHCRTHVYRINLHILLFRLTINQSTFTSVLLDTAAGANIQVLVEKIGTLCFIMNF